MKTQRSSSSTCSGLFLDKGAPLECPGAEALVPGIDEIAAACRSLRIPVIFVKVLRFSEVRETLAHLAG